MAYHVGPGIGRGTLEESFKSFAAVQYAAMSLSQLDLLADLAVWIKSFANLCQCMAYVE